MEQKVQHNMPFTSMLNAWADTRSANAPGVFHRFASPGRLAVGKHVRDATMELTFRLFARRAASQQRCHGNQFLQIRSDRFQVKNRRVSQIMSHRSQRCARRWGGMRPCTRRRSGGGCGSLCFCPSDPTLWREIAANKVCHVSQRLNSFQAIMIAIILSNTQTATTAK